MNNSTNTIYVVSWNTTRMCNLRCAHCYLDADYLEGRKRDELSTEEGKALIDTIAVINPNAVLILTGGEPLLRDDILALIRYSSEKGLMPVLGTNGILLDEKNTDELLLNGLKGIGVSIDSINKTLHDKFRGRDGAWERTVKGITIAKDKGLGFQIQTTATKENYHEIDEIIDFSYELGCKAFNLFFLVCTGRGHGLTDITPQQYEALLAKLVSLQDKYGDKMIIKAKCAPHFKRVAYQHNINAKALEGYTSDCLAGKHYCRVTPDGYVTPCPYMPLGVGNVKKASLEDIWNKAPVFQHLRTPELKGKCGKCEYKIICGGCRARSFAFTDDYLHDDPWCEYTPQEDKPVVMINKKVKYWTKEYCSLIWTDEAKERLEKIPFFVRNMVIKSIERQAKDRGINLITLQIMDEFKSTSKGHPFALIRK